MFNEVSDAVAHDEWREVGGEFEHSRVEENVVIFRAVAKDFCEIKIESKQEVKKKISEIK